MQTGTYIIQKKTQPPQETPNTCCTGAQKTHSTHTYSTHIYTNTHTHLHLILLAQEQPHVRKSARIQSAPYSVGLPVHQRPAPHQHVVLHEVHHGFRAQCGPTTRGTRRHNDGELREGGGEEEGVAFLPQVGSRTCTQTTSINHICCCYCCCCVLLYLAAKPGPTENERIV